MNKYKAKELHLTRKQTKQCSFTWYQINYLQLGTVSAVPYRIQLARARMLNNAAMVTSCHISLSIMSRIICIGMSPSVLIASLFGSGLIKYNVGSPRTCNKFALLHRFLPCNLDNIDTITSYWINIWMIARPLQNFMMVNFAKSLANTGVLTPILPIIKETPVISELTSQRKFCKW